MVLRSAGSLNQRSSGESFSDWFCIEKFAANPKLKLDLGSVAQSVEQPRMLSGLVLR